MGEYPEAPTALYVTTAATLIEKPGMSKISQWANLNIQRML